MEPTAMSTAIHTTTRLHSGSRDRNVRRLSGARPVAIGAQPSADLINKVNAKVGARLAKRNQTVHVWLEISRDIVNQTHMHCASLIAACVLEISDLSVKQAAISIRITACSITITGSNPISMPHADLCPESVVLDHAEAAGLPVRLAWEQCMGPQLMIELTPGGFTLNRAFRLARDPARVSGR
jgi:hypothetical protein